MMTGPRRVVLTVLLGLLAAPARAQDVPTQSEAMLQSQGAFQPAEEQPDSFPNLPGRDLAFGFCAACHGFRIVASQGMSRQQWESSLTWMTQRHNMPELDPADRDVIVGYLAAAFPPRTVAGGRAGWTNPFTAKP